MMATATGAIALNLATPAACHSVDTAESTSCSSTSLAMTRMTTAERTLLDRCRADPAFFFTNILGADPHPVHVEIADALATSSRVSVVGCNGSGKDWTSARMILWWLSTRYPAKVVVLAPTHRQVHEIVWRECRTAYNNSLRCLLAGG